MKNPSDTIEQNFEALATEMMDLQVCSSRVVRKEPKRMDEWLERKYSSTIDFVEIKREWNKLKGDHLNNLKTREALNCRVIDSLKAAIALKKVVQAIMELIETPSNEVKTVMKNPSDTIEQNLEALATEMMDLQFCSSRVVRKEPKLMEGWLLESKQSAVTDFVEIQREWNKLKGDHLNNLKTREALNCRVIDSLKAAIALRKVVQAIMELIETLSNEVKTGEPKQEAVTHSKKEKEKEISLTGEKGDKPKPEGVTLLKEVMENPIDTLDQNLEALATQIVALKFCSSRVVRKDPKRMEVWLESTQSVMNDFVEIRREWNKLKGDHLNNLKTRDALNCRVIDSLKAAIALKKVFQAIMELIETLSNEVETGEPKQEAVTHSKKEKGDKPKSEGVTLLKEVMETSDLKIDKPIEFTPEELKRFTMNFSNEAGYDQIGDVFEGRISSGQQIFVTVLKEFDNIEENLFMAEVNKMFRVSHKNMVKLYGFCFHQNIKAVVHEYVDNHGPLDAFLYYSEHDDMVWEILYEIAVQTAMGLSYLHDGFHDPIVLGDIGTSNVLLDSNFSPKVKHFRVEKLMDRTHVRRFAAPEMLMLFPRITHKCDVFSFGMMLLEILGRRENKNQTGNRPGGWGPKRIWDMYKKGQLDELVDEWAVGDKNSGIAKVMCMVALWCMQFTPEIRPPMSTVVKMLAMEIPVPTPPNPLFPSSMTSPLAFISDP